MKTRKLLLTALSMMLVATSAFAFASCDQLKGAKGDKGETGDKGATGANGQNGLGVESVEYDADGNLKITYTDGTSDIVDVPAADNHNYGDWNLYLTGDAFCGKALYYRVCDDCHDLNWKQDQTHAWTVDTYTAATCVTEGYEKKVCATCEEVDEHVLPMGHNADAAGVCGTCAKQVVGTEGLVYKLALDGNSYEVTNYVGTTGDIVIPDEYEGLPVTAIAANAFDVVTKAQLKGVITSVKIADSVTEIRTNAFTQCEALASVTLGKNVKKMGGWIFKDCLALKSVILPEGLEEIGDSTFRNCGITSLTIPSTVTTLGNGVFYNADGLTGEFVIPDSVTTIGPDLFRNASNITSVKLPAGLKEIPDMMFGGCDNLETLILPETVESIGAQNFYKCSKLKTLYLGENVCVLGGYLFYNMTGLDTLNIYYNGTSAMWDDIMMSNAAHSTGFTNDPEAIKARVFFYSETAPTTEGQFWHYDENGKFAIWPAYEAPGSDAEQAPGSDAEQAPGSDAEQAPGSDAEQAPGSDAEQAPGSDAEQAPGSDAEQAPGTSEEAPKNPTIDSLG